MYSQVLGYEDQVRSLKLDLDSLTTRIEERDHYITTLRDQLTSKEMDVTRANEKHKVCQQEVSFFYPIFIYFSLFLSAFFSFFSHHISLNYPYYQVLNRDSEMIILNKDLDEKSQLAYSADQEVNITFDYYHFSISNPNCILNPRT